MIVHGPCHGWAGPGGGIRVVLGRGFYMKNEIIWLARLCLNRQLATRSQLARTRDKLPANVEAAAFAQQLIDDGHVGEAELAALESTASEALVLAREVPPPQNPFTQPCEPRDEVAEAIRNVFAGLASSVAEIQDELMRQACAHEDAARLLHQREASLRDREAFFDAKNRAIDELMASLANREQFIEDSEHGILEKTLRLQEKETELEQLEEDLNARVPARSRETPLVLNEFLA